MTASQSQPASPIGDIVILGGGTAGWMAAAALAKALANTGTRITLVESDDIGIVGVGEATVPSIHAFNALLGLSQADFMRNCQATIKLGIAFVDWGDVGRRYMHAFSPYGAPPASPHFDRLWMKYAKVATAQGETIDIDACNLGALAAGAGRFALPGATVPPGTLNYAYHFDAGLYGQYLRQYATARGVVRIEGQVTNVTQHAETGHIQALTLQSGQVVAGDFFIDCSGFTGLLIEKTLHTGYLSWRHWLRCDRAIAVQSEAVAPPVPYTVSTADQAGWMWRIPLQSRIGNGCVYSSAHITDDEAEARLMAQIDGPALTQPRRVPFETGRRNRVWNGNCLALGLAAGFLEPLESTSIHLIQTSLFRLLALFPDTRFAAAEINEFNRQTTEEYENIRDFLIAHYKLGRRSDTAFWRECQDMAVPERVSQIIGLFAVNGRVAARPEHLFSAQSWLAVLLGQGPLPQGYDPLLRPMPEAELMAYMTDARGKLERMVAAMPRHVDFLRDYCPAAPLRQQGA